MKQELICTQCGHIGVPIKVTKGSILLEVLLWLFFIVPGLIYSIWRLSTRYNACQKCKSSNIIPTDSPAGQKLIAANNKI